ncbi:MAG: DMT family transporter [Actinomycetia bacterium]|nr:DMT family transporter [Actinomycetes bacterium]
MPEALDHKLAPTLAMLFVTLVWGATFLIVQRILTVYPPYLFLALRFALAALFLVIMKPKLFKHIRREDLIFGGVAGLILAAGYILQTMSLLPAALGGTTAARSAFITGMYVVITPVAAAVIYRKKPTIGVVLGAVLVVIGLYFMSGITFGSAQINWVRGDTLVLIATFTYAAHILWLAHPKHAHDTVALTFIQMLMVSLSCLVLSVGTGEKWSLPPSWDIWLMIIVCAIFASALAFMIETWVLKRLPPARVALLEITESFFGGMAGWLWLRHAPFFEVIGASCILGGMLLSELVALWRVKRDKIPVEFYGDPFEGPPLVITESNNEEDYLPGIEPT